MAFAVQQRLEQFARFTGRADNQSLPHFQQFRLGNSGDTAEVLQIGIGNQMVQISQTYLIFGEQNDMPGLSVSDPPAGAQTHHGRVDGLQGVDVVLLLQHLHELGHDKAAGHGVIPGPVVVEVRQIQGVGYNVQLEFVQVPQKVLGQNQGVGGGVLIFKALPLTLRPDEAGVKVRIVGHQHPIADKIQEFWQYFFNFRCACQHFLRDARQLHDLPLQMPLRVYEGLETVDFLPIFQNYRADFDDAVSFGGQAGGFQIEGHELVMKGHVLIAVHHNAVIHVVDIISFAAVENFNCLIGARHLGGLLPFHGVQGVSKGLAAAVVGDGDGPVPPGRCLLDGSIGGGQGVHVGHGGVQMQLHPLHAFRRVFSFRQTAGLHGVGLEHHFVLKPILDELALHPKNRADIHIFQNGFCLVCLHKPANADRIGIVGHVEFYHIGVALFQLLVVNVEHLSLHDHCAHIHRQILHGHGVSLEGLAVEGLAGGGGGCRLPLLFGGRNGGQVLHHLAPHGLHGFKQGLALQRRAGFDGNGHGRGKPFPQHLLHRRHLLHERILTVGGQMDGQVFPLPLPPGPGKRTPCHGIPLDKEVHQLLRLDFCQLVGRVGSVQNHMPQAVERPNLLRRLIHQPLGDVSFGMHHHMDGSILGGNVRSGDSRLRKRWVQRLRRLIVGKHLK